jgi:hypothetical protein
LERSKWERAVREIRTLRATWRGLETWHGRKACRRASPRPYCAADGGKLFIGRLLRPDSEEAAVMVVERSEQPTRLRV